MGLKYFSYVRSLAPSRMQTLSNPSRTLAIKWEVNIFLKKSSCVCCSLRRYVSSIYMYISAWISRWQYNKSGICLCLPPDRTWHKVTDLKVGFKCELRKEKFQILLDLAGHRLTLCHLSLMRVAGHGPKHGSKHSCLVIVWTGQESLFAGQWPSSRSKVREAK